jgi:urea transport system ATP-binding protein
MSDTAQAKKPPLAAGLMPTNDGLLGSSKRYRRAAASWVIFLIALVGVPLLYHYDQMSIVSVNLLGQYLAFAIVAVSLDLVWGYAGLLCLCQALFFCLGGYAMGMYLAHHGGPEGIIDHNGWKLPACLYVVYPYKVGEQPSDALVPWFWKPFWSLWSTLILGVLIPGAVAGVIGFFVFRSRVRGVFFAVLTQAIALAAWLIFTLNDIKCGGTNGLTRFDRVILGPQEKIQVQLKPDRLTDEKLSPSVITPALEQYIKTMPGAVLSESGSTYFVSVPNGTHPLTMKEGVDAVKVPEGDGKSVTLASISDIRLAGYLLTDDNTRMGLYVLTVLALGGAYALCRFVITSRVGQVLIAVRDNENRLRFFGYEPYHFKVFVFALSGMLGGLGGMLYVPQKLIITPHNLSVLESIMVVIWVAVGGRATLSGAILGTLVVKLAYMYFTSQHEMLWFAKGRIPDRVYDLFTWRSDYWMFMLGSLFVAVVLLLPDGLVSLPKRGMEAWHWLRRRRDEADPGDESLDAAEGTGAGTGGENAASLQTRLQRVNSLQRERTLSSQHRSLLDTELVRVENVKVIFDGFKALDIDQFSIDYYELQVVIGPNGAGKTTLCDVISGKTRATSGQIFFGKTEITHIPEVDIARLGVGRKFQTPSIFDGLTVFESMELALPGRQALQRNFRHKATPADRDRIYSILKRVRLDREAGKRVKYLSHGQRQWLEISMLLLASPHLLLVDEPAAGLTDEETALTAELLLELQDEHSVMVIEHDMEFVRLLNAPVTVLNEGSVMAHGTLDQVQADPRVVEAYLGRGGTRQQA